MFAESNVLSKKLGREESLGASRLLGFEILGDKEQTDFTRVEEKYIDMKCAGRVY